MAKSVFGDTIAGLNSVRAGLVTLHAAGGQRNGIKASVTSVNTPVREMNSSPTTGDKKTLLDALYSIDAANGTPLRTTLKSVGQYLECDPVRTILTGHCPALSAAEGGACQQNFVIFMTDGFENGSSPSVGNTDSNGTGPWDGGAHADTYSSTLADVAMHYYERDLQPGLANNVPVTPGVDEASHQHMVTYTVTFIGASGHLNNDPPNRTDAFTWPNPQSSTDLIARIDDLRHAAFNGRGSFRATSDPDALRQALQDAVQNIVDRTSSAASVALNSGSRNVNSRVYQARFNSGDWTGQLLSFPVNENGTLAAAEWDAGTVADSLHFDTRKVITYKPSTRAGIAFRWDVLDASQQAALNTNAAGVADASGNLQGQARLNYIRGSREHESTGNNYRVRPHLLGDLINSDPFFMGGPPLTDAIGSGYSAFRNTYGNRTPIIAVGGNDGMLHIFNANNGQELLAYVPSKVFPLLSKLTAQIYAHRYFVDGSPTAGDAYIDATGTGTRAWRTVLVSGLRAGGQGYFALDVTNPATFGESTAANHVLWEFTDANNADLGFSFSQPSIVRMANGRWAAVFGNGYNSTVSDGNASTTGRAVLFIVFLDGARTGTWQQGIDYIKLDTRVGTVAAPNGLATPAPIDIPCAG